MPSETMLHNPAIIGPIDPTGAAYLFTVVGDDGLPCDACHTCALTAFCLGQEVRCDGTTRWAHCDLCGHPIDPRTRERIEHQRWLDALDDALDDFAREQRAA